MGKIPHNPDERIAVVNKKDEIIGKTTRKKAHEEGSLHREVINYLINSKNQLLLHKREDNHLWDTSSSGHFPAEQNYGEAAAREFEEELGIKINKTELNEIAKEIIEITSHKGKNYRFVKIFLIKKEIPINKFKIDKEEIEEIKYFGINELKKLLSQPEKITKTSKYFIEKYILKEIK
ncbi:MAG TPA: NUDIX domain-containing protein [Candidatus Nanoarchaeia archaeon]|nr:NUDIX domain-containing protein [Candidatus Nanoarchaeia archaeon]